MEMVLEPNGASDWAYRGEGAANLVLAYSGSSSNFIGKVLRIQKAARNETSLRALSAQEGLVWKDIDGIVSAPTKEHVGQLYVERVMSPLLGSNFVDAGIRVPVSRDFLESIENNVISKRPAWRIDAAKVDTNVDSVLLLSDHSLFPRGAHEGEPPCICVEIKPKCGFLPISELISEGNAIKRTVPRYRMHQALKLHQGEISAYSEYDPLDLFSGSKDRIYKAVRDLFFSPQNNFRVFLDGDLIFGTLGSAAESTDLRIQEAFEDAIKSVVRGDHGLRTDSFLKLISETIYVSGVMDRLLQVQKLDSIDVEGVIHAYYNVISEPCKVCKELGEEISRRYTNMHSVPLDESLKVVKNFLIAATAKDCSLMMSFRPRKEGTLECSYKNVYLESTDQTFDYKVCFIDLDLKSLRKMEEYYEKDQKIVRCYTQMLEADKSR